MTIGRRRPLLRFFAVGAINTGVGVAAIAFASVVFLADAYLANAIGFAVGIAVGYQLNRRWTFGSSQSALITAPRYLLVFALCYALNLGVLTALLRCPLLHPLLAQAAAIASYSLAFYLLCRFVVFADRD